VKAAACLLLCGLATAQAACQPTDAGAVQEPQAPLEALEPAGATAWPFEFRWAGTGPDTVVRVHVLDEAERPLYGIEARGDHVTAPRALETLLRAGGRYQWRVARVDENGEESGESELKVFTMR
jgi:hypothetical protein